jgi:hypothetical protein
VDETSGYRSNTRYALRRQITDHDGAAMKTATVTVQWNDRHGEAQQVLLQSTIATIAPGLSGALSAPEGRQPLKTVHGRPPAIPLQARDLRDGRSALKPSSAAAIVFIFDHTTGRIVQRCSGTGASGIEPSLDTLGDCMTIDALLLSGWVRVSLVIPPNAQPADEVTLPLSIALALDDRIAPLPECFVEAKAHALAYHCVIVSGSADWSGRSGVVPQDWTVGTSAGQYQVCRYASDQDGSGAVDRNAEHPGTYRHVNANLMQQNFLIIRGEQLCPAPLTAPHQP